MLPMPANDEEELGLGLVKDDCGENEDCDCLGNLIGLCSVP